MLKTTSVDAFRADGAQLDPTALGDPTAFAGNGYMLLGLEITGLAAAIPRRLGPPRRSADGRWRRRRCRRRGLSHACSVYGSSLLVLPEASLEAVAVRASLCTQGEINQALLYADGVGDRHARGAVDDA